MTKKILLIVITIIALVVVVVYAFPQKTTTIQKDRE